MTTLYHFKAVKALEELASNCGFEISFSNAYHDESVLSLVPKDESLPIYSRNAILMRGSVEELIAFLQGWNKMKEYLILLRATDDKKIDRKEQDYKNNILVKIIKGQTVKDENDAPF